MTVNGAEMLGAASFSRRAGIPSSPVLFDVLSSLSYIDNEQTQLILVSKRTKIDLN